MKKCPYCAEDIQDAAIKCRYCGSDLTVPPPAITAPTPSAAPASAEPETPVGAPEPSQFSSSVEVPAVEPAAVEPAAVEPAAVEPAAVEAGSSQQAVEPVVETPTPTVATTPTGETPEPTVAGTPTASQAPAGPVGPVSFSHTGYRYVLGYGPDYYGIWSREQPAAPMARFPRTDEGWREAWTRFSALEPNAQPVT